MKTFHAGTAAFLTVATLLSGCATYDARYAYPDARYETNTRYGERDGRYYGTDGRYYGTDSRYRYPDARYEGWANDTAIRYNGRIPRDVYIDEMGRRWESDANRRGTRDVYLNDLRGRWSQADRDNRGLTPAEISQMTGKVDSSTSGIPMSGSGVQPGNMGPANSKGQ